METYYKCLEAYPSIKKDGRYCHAMYVTDVYERIFKKPAI